MGTQLQGWRPRSGVKVSIQLMSPASGNFWDFQLRKMMMHNNHVSIQLMSPASGNVRGHRVNPSKISVSIQLMSPASGNVVRLIQGERTLDEVSIQLMSPASGNCNQKKQVETTYELFPFN